MCSDAIVKVKGLGKCYHMYKKPHERLLQSVFRGRKKYYQEFWSLRNISFHVKPGETVGIVGRNGSGKTTLLQLVCGTLSPTEGVCHVTGRVAALLALGAGFNPEYTGEENIYLYASLLGLSKKQIRERFGDICDFADIGDFILQPVKKYSSGMYMRLAFSVAIHVEPDILIVDEALAVGDEAFQRKCYARLEQLKENGMALLFVSHSSSSVISLCDRALLLEKGSLLADGQPKEIISLYHKLLFSAVDKVSDVIKEIRSGVSKPVSDSKKKSEEESPTYKAHYIEGMQSKSLISYESVGAKIMPPYMTTLDGKKVNVLCKGETYKYRYRVNFDRDCYRVRFGMLMKTVTGIEVGGAASESIENAIEFVQKDSNYEIVFSFVCRLNPGVYFLNAGVKCVENGEEIYLHRILDALMIRVMPEEHQRSTAIVDFDFNSEVNLLSS